MWCEYRLGASDGHTLGDTSAFVNTAVQLLLTRRGKTRMDGIGVVFEFYIAPLNMLTEYKGQSSQVSIVVVVG